MSKSLEVESDDEEFEQGMKKVSKRLKNIPFYRNMKTKFYYDSDKTESEDSNGSDEEYSNTSDSDSNTTAKTLLNSTKKYLIPLELSNL